MKGTWARFSFFLLLLVITVLKQASPLLWGTGKREKLKSFLEHLPVCTESGAIKGYSCWFRSPYSVTTLPFD